MSDVGDNSDKEKEVEMVYGDSQDPTYSGPDRRTGKDRRSGENRRKGFKRKGIWITSEERLV